MSSVQCQSAHDDLMANRDMVKNKNTLEVWICIIDTSVLDKISMYRCSLLWYEVPPRTVLYGEKKLKRKEKIVILLPQ